MSVGTASLNGAGARSRWATVDMGGRHLAPRITLAASTCCAAAATRSDAAIAAIAIQSVAIRT